MSEFEMKHNDLDNHLNSLLDQLAPDAPPVGFTARTMDVIRPQVSVEPFRVHWSDFVPAFVAAILGALILFVWLGAAGAHSIIGGTGSLSFLDSVSEIQLIVACAAIGLFVGVYPLVRGNFKSGKSWFFSMI